MNLTVKQLESLKACSNGIAWFKNQKKRKLGSVVKALLEDNHFDYARWLLSRLMTHPQKVQWTVYSAEQVVEIFEKKYPNDLRPRGAIQAAKDFLAGKISSVEARHAADAAANAAAYAVYATYATVKDADAAYVANAADAVAYAANSGYAAVNAAYAAANAVAYATANAAANAADASRKSMEKKIMQYGLTLLGE